MTGFLDGGLIEGGAGYQIQRSLRLRASATAYLSRTFGTPTDAKKWTYSVCMKRGILGTQQTHFTANGAADNANYGELWIRSNDTLSFYGWSAEFRNTTSVFRDPTAFYHLMFVWDSTQAAEVDRFKIYSNNALQTTAALGLSISLNQTGPFNISGKQHRIGLSSGAQPFDGYLSEVNFIDGQALTPSSFGQIDAVTGQWSAKKYTGTYGTNGFYLPFTDTTSPTTLCYDASGNGNHWTPNNISTTAGATYDSMTDAPLSYGTVDRGNFCTLSPLSTSSYVTVSQGNLRAIGNTTADNGMSAGTFAMGSGQWYWEMTVEAIGWSAGQPVASLNFPQFGMIRKPEGIANGIYNGGASTGGFFYGANGSISVEAVTGTSITGMTVGDVVAFAYDRIANTCAIYRNNTLATTLALSNANHFPLFTGYANSAAYFNFGQRPFAFSPPAGFKSLHTGNLTSDTVTVSGSFTGNLSTDGPCIWINGAPETLTINGNAVTWGTHADKLASGFKLRSSSASYNASGTNTWTATILSPSLKSSFRNQLAKGNP